MLMLIIYKLWMITHFHILSKVMQENIFKHVDYLYICYFFLVFFFQYKEKGKGSRGYQ